MTLQLSNNKFIHIVKYATLIITLFICQQVAAEKFLLTVEVGVATIKIDKSYQMTNSTLDTQDSVAFSALFGYKFKSNFVLCIASSYYHGNSSFGANDRVHINDGSALVGYEFKANRKLNIIPMLGVNYWKLRSKEGAFLNSGPEEERVFRGNDSLAKVIFEIASTRMLGLNISYTYGRYDFGDLHSINAGMRFNFH